MGCRPPRGGRGLKREVIDPDVIANGVAPRAGGAWIETRGRWRISGPVRSPPVRWRERAIGAKCIHVEARHSEPKVQPANPDGFLCHNLLLLGDLCRPTPEKRLKPCSAGLPT